MPDIADEIKEYISTRLARGRRDIDADKSLFKEGIIDSFALIELAFFLREKYGVAIDEYCIMSNNLESVSQIAQYIEKESKK